MVRYEKIEPREPTFELDEFNEPMEVTGPDVWVRDVVAMAFYEQGTFADDPQAGAAINYEVYNFDDEAARIIQERMNECCKKYLSDIPIESLDVSIYAWEEMNTNVLVLNVTFRDDRGLLPYAVYISLIDHQLRYVVNQLYAK